MKKSMILITFFILSFVHSTYAACGCKPQSIFKRGSINSGKKLPTELRDAGREVQLIDGDQLFISRDFVQFGGFRASIEEDKKWPDNTIPYMFSGISKRDQTKIRNALSDLSKKTGNCVKFTEIQKAPSQGGYAHVYKGSGCYSYVGNLNSKQEISLGRGCTHADTIQHEFMHTLGFYHEHNRPDRDKYVKINWKNIDSEMCDNFNKCKGCKSTTPYDIKSIMHYEGNAFSCRWSLRTMEDRENLDKRIKMNRKLTQYDIKKIKDFYGC